VNLLESGRRDLNYLIEDETHNGNNCFGCQSSFMRKINLIIWMKSTPHAHNSAKKRSKGNEKEAVFHLSSLALIEDSTVESHSGKGEEDAWKELMRLFV